VLALYGEVGKHMVSVNNDLALGPVLGGYNALMGSTFCLLGFFSGLLSLIEGAFAIAFLLLFCECKMYMFTLDFICCVTAARRYDH
jgi:hypothetical protein